MIKYKCKTVRMRLTVGWFKSWLKSDLQCFESNCSTLHREITILLNLEALHFFSGDRCQFYTSSLEVMQTSWRGLRRTTRWGWVTKDAPKERAEEAVLVHHRKVKGVMLVADMQNAIIKKMVISTLLCPQEHGEKRTELSNSKVAEVKYQEKLWTPTIS